jgi:hypothetical protein
MVRGKKKRGVRRKVSVKSKSSVKNEPSMSYGRRIFSKFKLRVVVRNLILFALLFVLSLILSKVCNGVFVDMFKFLWIMFAFISIAFFIALLILLFLKAIKK